MDSPTSHLIKILQDRVAFLRAGGNIDEALHAASATIEKTMQALDTDLDSIDSFASALEIRGDIYRELDKFELALDDYSEAIDQLQDRPDRFDQLGRLQAGLGAAYDGLGRTQDASRAWLLAICYFERHDPPLLLDISAMANNLGFLAKAAGDIETAETHFLQALEITHAQLGQHHEQTATISSNLGALYQATGFFEQAREMHMIALDTRQSLLGDTHPDTAQSHNNLALVLLQTGDRQLARGHFEQALDGFEALGTEFAPDLEAVASNYCGFLRQEGEDTRASTIAARIRELVRPTKIEPWMRR